MLFQLGALQIDTAPFNAHQTAESASADFAAHDVIGALRPQEYMGEGDDEMTISGRLFPHKFGGLDELGLLRQMLTNGEPQILVRGDGVNKGWRIITNVSVTSTYLDASGVGRVLEVEIKTKRCPRPTASQFVAILYRLLAQ